jgi:hypothetical protein
MLEKDILYFSPPQQLSGTPSLSLWHIGVLLKPNSLLKSIEGCRVFVIVGLFESHKMRWRSDDVRGNAEITLRLGNEPELIPITIRSEIDAEFNGVQLPAYSASLLNEGFLVHRAPYWLAEGPFPITVEVRSFEKKWSQKYILEVPNKKTSNGHFILRSNDIDDLADMGFFNSVKP